jgi:hypothetical protein
MQFAFWVDPRSVAVPAAASFANASLRAEVAAGGGGVCDACPRHATCGGGAVVAPLRGFWHSSPNS